MNEIDFLQLKSSMDWLEQRPSSDCLSIQVPQDKLLIFCRYLKESLCFNLLSDATVVDLGVSAQYRYMVVYHMLSTESAQYLRVSSFCENNEHPSSQSLSSLYPAADWHEREAYDMFGVRFVGHPDLRRILMWDGYKYHPLRKDFPLAGVDHDFPSQEIGEETGVRVMPAPMTGGPFTATHGSTVQTREPQARDESWNEANSKRS